MDCIFPGAANLEEFWRNVCEGVDAIAELPDDRLPPIFCDPSSPRSDRLPGRRGGFIDAYARFDPLAFGIMPVAADKAEPDQLLALDVATRALRMRGMRAPRCRPRAPAWCWGAATTPGRAGSRLEQHVRVRRAARRTRCATLCPALERGAARGGQARVPGAIGAAAGESAIGLVPNLAASRIANRLDLRGPAYTVDAACASALRRRRSARARSSRAGARDVDARAAACTSATTSPSGACFSQLGALSRSGEIRPFDGAPTAC